MPALGRLIEVSSDVPTPICVINRKSGGKTAALQKRAADKIRLQRGAEVRISALHFHSTHIAAGKQLTLLP